MANMVLPRVSSIGRTVLSRTSASCFSAQNAAQSRAFASCNRLLRDKNFTPGEKPTEEAHRRTITLLGLPRTASKREVRALFDDAGLKVTKSQFRVDRFTFYNDTHFHVELADSDQASQALQLGESAALDGKRIYVLPVHPDFAWRNLPDQSNRWFYYEGSNMEHAVLPIKEGRRVQVRVQTPAWLPRFETKPEYLQTSRKKYGQKIIAEAFDRYGLEAMGAPASFDGRPLPDPKFFCHLDFKTKDGAEEAVRAMHETEIKNRLIWVTKTRLNEVRANQIGRMDKGVLKELQRLRLAPEI